MSRATDPAILLYAADGAGTASRSREGAERVCQSFANFFEARLFEGARVDDITESECLMWLAIARQSLREMADAEDIKPNEFACTFLGAILGESASLFLQIGDGAIVVSCPEEPDEYDPVVWPEQGEYANMTFFVTGEDAEDHLLVSKANRSVAEVALFTDGLQRLALHMASKSAHSPFFRNFFGRLRKAAPGVSEPFCASIKAFLASAPVLERTDDDKSLVLATRFVAMQENHAIAG